MIRITKYERILLENAGLIKYRKVGFNPQDANIQIANREHVSRDKTIFITEEPEIMKFLGNFENFNMQKISNSQLEFLKKNGLVTDETIQNFGEYKENALVYIKSDGIILIERNSNSAKLMVALGYWKNRK